MRKLFPLFFRQYAFAKHHQQERVSGEEVLRAAGTKTKTAPAKQGGRVARMSAGQGGMLQAPYSTRNMSLGSIN